LQRIPKELTVIVLKRPNEQITDKTYLVRRNKIIAALQFLKENNEDYLHIEISAANASQYPIEGILQDAPQVDPVLHNIRKEAVSAVNEESAREAVSTVDMPGPGQNLLDLLRTALLEDNQNNATVHI
jgi:hypothetical protein